MKAYKTKTWQHETTGTETNIRLLGINPFEYEWVSTGKRGKIKNSCGQILSCAVKKISVDGNDYEFIAVEASNGVWTFYTYKF